jgi:Tol biopolymer transport system component
VVAVRNVQKLRLIDQRPASVGAFTIAGWLVVPIIVIVALVIIFSQILLANQARRQIAYYAFADGLGAVRLMDIDRMLYADLFRINDWVVTLAWSPDGEKLVFISYENGYYFLNVMDADGRNVHRLTDHTASNRLPVWSNDGQIITFEAGGYLPYMAIFRIDASGENVRVLVENISGATSDLSWSPDGQQVALAATIDDSSTFEIFAMNTDCIKQNSPCQPERLTDNAADDRSPVWSPDGKRIAFLSNRDGKLEVYALEADCADQPDGCQAHQLTNIGVSGSSILSWSPDGRWLSFEASVNDVSSVIYVMDMTCETLDDCPKLMRRITSTQDHSTSAAWSADSREIVYISRINGTVLALLDIDTCIQLDEDCPETAYRLTPSSDTSWSPVWRP